MGILDELNSKTSQLDELRAWLASQPKKDRDEWTVALTDTRYSCGAVARLLTAKGFPCKDNLIYRYRRAEAFNVNR
jgi:hypothetical protein